MNDFEELYSHEGIYGKFLYGSPWVNRGIRCAQHICKFHAKCETIKILCFGSGNGYEAVQFLKNGNDTYTVDLYVPEVNFLKGRQIRAYGQDMPFKDKSFDLLFSCETLEHVKEEWVDDILKEAKRVSDEVFFTIATVQDPFDSHICLHDITWWIDKFTDLSFEIINAQWMPRLTTMSQHFIATINWPDGVLIHAKC
jgi:cyclopropane fatty-acyl-phospholipid synthase-like methyltransferase